MRKSIYLLLVLLMSLSACDQLKLSPIEKEEDPNLVKSYYDNGKLKAEVRLNDDKKRHGLSKQYYPSGQVKSEIIYENDRKKKAIQFYENGNKQMEFNYVNGLKQGKRTKYWKDGSVSSILNYDKNNPGTELIEYNKQGKQITKYPSLKISQIDYLEDRGEYWIEVYFSSNPNRGKYYIGELENGYMPVGLEEIDKINGKGRIIIRPAPGSFIMKKIKVIGKFTTGYGNPYITQTQANVAIDY